MELLAIGKLAELKRVARWSNLAPKPLRTDGYNGVSLHPLDAKIIAYFCRRKCVEGGNLPFVEYYAIFFKACLLKDSYTFLKMSGLAGFSSTKMTSAVTARNNNGNPCLLKTSWDKLYNTFLAQAYDLDDEWGLVFGPCFEEWSCCDYNYIHFNSTSCNATLAKRCQNACASTFTPNRGGSHPRNKKLVGDRLGTAAFNTVYGGTGPITGPTLLSCSVDENSLWIRFDPELL
jgi:hypothetical protein